MHEQPASEAVSGSRAAMKRGGEGPVSIATALREVLAQWQANHGAQAAAGTKPPLYCVQHGGEQHTRWQTQVMRCSLRCRE